MFFHARWLSLAVADSLAGARTFIEIAFASPRMILVLCVLSGCATVGDSVSATDIDAWVRSVWYPGGFTPDVTLSGGSCKLLYLGLE